MCVSTTANETAYCDASTDLSEPSIAINIFEIRLLDVVNEFSSLPPIGYYYKTRNRIHLQISTFICLNNIFLTSILSLKEFSQMHTRLTTERIDFNTLNWNSFRIQSLNDGGHH
jgi:hypothetical protein